MMDEFVVPDQNAQRKAIGSLTAEKMINKKAFSNFGRFFRDVDAPGPSDWLSCHREKGQGFELFRGIYEPLVRNRKKFYVQPIGENFDGGVIRTLLEFARAFFPNVVFEVKGEVSLEKFEVKKRKNCGVLQYHGGQILGKLRQMMNGNALAMIGITFEDIYNGDDNNYVFGLGSAASKTGVFSFARYDRRFWGEEENNELLTYCAVKVMIHEMCHMFGLSHCIYFSCLMNGSNHLEEGSKKPFHLCPVCTRKILYLLNFNILEWYRTLTSLFIKHGRYFDRNIEWYESRVTYLSN